MFNWEIRKIYEDMIDMYEKKVGQKTKFNVKITNKFIDILKKRLSQLSSRYRKDWYNG